MKTGHGVFCTNTKKDTTKETIPLARLVHGFPSQQKMIYFVHKLYNHFRQGFQSQTNVLALFGI